MAQQPSPFRRSPSDIFGAYVEFAKVGLSNVFLVNAGSATVLITFLGGSRDTGTKTGANNQALVETFISNGGAVWAVKCFAVGAFLAILGSAFLAFQENWNSDRRENGKSLVAYLGALGGIFLVGSGVAFLVGCFGAVK